MTKLSVHQRKARDFIQREDWGNALVELERMLGADSQNPTLHNQIGDVYLRKDEVGRALEHFERAIELYAVVGLHNNAVALCKKIQRLRPARIEVRFRLAKLRFEQGFKSDAAISFREYLEHASHESPDLMEQRCREIVELMPEEAPIGLVLEKLEGAKRFVAAFEIVRTLAQRAADAGDDSAAKRYGEKMRSLRVLVERSGGRDLLSEPQAQSVARADASPSLPPGTVAAPFVPTVPMAPIAPGVPVVPAAAAHAGASNAPAAPAFDNGSRTLFEPRVVDLGAPGRPAPQLTGFAPPALAVPPGLAPRPPRAAAEPDATPPRPNPTPPAPAFDALAAAPPSPLGRGATAPAAPLAPAPPRATAAPPAPPRATAAPPAPRSAPAPVVRETPLGAHATPPRADLAGLEGLPIIGADFDAFADQPADDAGGDDTSAATESASFSDILLPATGVGGAVFDPIGAADAAEDADDAIDVNNPFGANALDAVDDDADAADAARFDPLAFDDSDDVEPEDTRETHFADLAAALGADDEDSGMLGPPAADHAPVAAQAAAWPAIDAASLSAPEPMRGGAAGASRWVDELRRSPVWIPTGDVISGPDPARPDRGLSMELESVIDSFREQMTRALDGDGQARYDLGVAYYDMGLYNEALAEFEAAAGSPGLEVQSYEMLAQCLLQTGRNGEVVELLLPVIAADGHTYRGALGLHYCLGLAYEAIGEFDQARHCYEEVALVDVDFKDVQSRLQRT